MGFPLLSEGLLYAEHECRRGHDIKIVLEDSEQLLLEYLSPVWVKFTPFLLSLPISGKGSRVRRFGSNWHGERFKEPPKRRRLRAFYRENITNSFTFILISSLIASSPQEIFCCSFSLAMRSGIVQPSFF